MTLQAVGIILFFVNVLLMSVSANPKPIPSSPTDFLRSSGGFGEWTDSSAGSGRIYPPTAVRESFADFPAFRIKIARKPKTENAPPQPFVAPFFSVTVFMKVII